MNNYTVSDNVNTYNYNNITTIKETDSSSTTTKHFKDNVFCLLYSDKKNLLDLYNALNNSSHSNIDDLTVTTLKGGAYMKYKNDASFVFSYELYMFEQQSTINCNMPLRFFHYGSEVYRDMFPNNLLHRKSMLKIPTPHFITFYNGREKMTERVKTLKLSDMFEQKTDSPELELIVTVINLNPDNVNTKENAIQLNDSVNSDTINKANTNSMDSSNNPDFLPSNSGLFIHDILKRCQSLRDYMTFVNKVRYKIDTLGLNIRNAVIDSVDECIQQDILSDFFIEHRDEVIDVSIFEYDEEGTMKVMREDYLEEGRAEARAEAQANMQNSIRNAMKALNKSAEEVMDILGLKMTGDIISSNNSEDAHKPSIFEYDEEGTMKVMKEDYLEEGRAEGRNDTLLSSIRNIMQSLNISADEAMDILKIAPDERAHFKELI